MPIERVDYQGSALEAADETKAMQQATGLVAAAHDFESGTGEPLYGGVQEQPWDDDGDSDEYQDGDEFGVDTEPYSEPAGEPQTLLEAARQEVAGLSEAEVLAVVAAWP